MCFDIGAVYICTLSSHTCICHVYIGNAYCNVDAYFDVNIIMTYINEVYRNS